MTATEPKPDRPRTIHTVLFVIAALVCITGFMSPAVRDFIMSAGILTPR